MSALKSLQFIWMPTFPYFKYNRAIYVRGAVFHSHHFHHACGNEMLTLVSDCSFTLNDSQDLKEKKKKLLFKNVVLQFLGWLAPQFLYFFLRLSRHFPPLAWSLACFCYLRWLLPPPPVVFSKLKGRLKIYDPPPFAKEGWGTHKCAQFLQLFPS